MATVDIEISQATVNKINRIDTGSVTNLSNIFGQVLGTSGTLSNYYNHFTSWSLSGDQVKLKFGSAASLTFSGAIFPHYYGSYTGTAVAHSRTQTAPGIFKESSAGTFHYDYYASTSYLSYTPVGIGTITSYKLESYQPDANLGKASYALAGNVNTDSTSGDVSGYVSNFTVSASKLGTVAIDGLFSVSGSTTDPTQSSVTGSINHYKEPYLDGSHIDLIGDFSIARNTVLDSSVLSDARYWSGNDCFRIILPNSISSEYILNAGDGNDTVIAGGGGGRLHINTGAGDDEITVINSSPAIDGGDGVDTIKTKSFSLDLVSYNHVENLTLLGTLSINGTGNELDNVITGNSGNNILNGAQGADTLVGGSGNDTYYVDNASDTVIELSNQGTDLVYASTNYTLSSNVEKLTLTGSANINGSGNNLANTITGNGGNNTLDGGTGADTMIGGEGSDVYIVDNVADVVKETNSSPFQIDEVQSSVSWTLIANLENLTLTGINNVNGTGNGLANTIIGNSGDNVLNGGAGNDTLTGGAGNDSFDLKSALNVLTNIDTITDFTIGDDKIRLENGIMKALQKTTGALDSNAFNSGSGFTSAQDISDRIVYDTTSGKLYYDADGNKVGGVAAVQIALIGIDSHPDLHNTDFSVI